MPIYEFKCQKCEEFFELLVMKNDDDEMKCPKCGEQSFERVLSTTNFNVKGGTSACSSAGSNGKAGIQERSCSGGSCTTYTIPGDN